jgi:hypothetical protein
MLDAYRDLIDELLGTPSEIRGLIDAEGRPEPSPEGRRLIAELRDRDRVVLDRVQTMMRQQTPYLRTLRVAPPVMDQDQGQDQNLAQLLDEMDVARGDLVSLLMNLNLKDWERAAIDESEGEITLADEVERHVEFDETHRGEIRDLLSPS